MLGGRSGRHCAQPAGGPGQRHHLPRNRRPRSRAAIFRQGALRRDGPLPLVVPPWWWDTRCSSSRAGPDRLAPRAAGHRVRFPLTGAALAAVVTAASAGGARDTASMGDRPMERAGRTLGAGPRRVRSRSAARPACHRSLLGFARSGVRCHHHVHHSPCDAHPAPRLRGTQVPGGDARAAAIDPSVLISLAALATPSGGATARDRADA